MGSFLNRRSLGLPVAAVTLVVLTLLAGPARPQDDDDAVQPGSGTTLADAVTLVSTVFDKDEAMKLLRAIDPFYRVRGNQGYMRSLERCFLVMREAGFADPSSDETNLDTVQFRDFGALLPAWTPMSASLAIVSPDVGTLHAFETEAGEERTFLCVNSFPTRQGGVVAPVVRYELGRPVESYTGTIVYGSLPASQLFERAVQQGRALGVISSYLPDYNEPDRNRDAIHFSTIPYDPERQAFGLNVSPAKKAVIERLLDGGMVYVRVDAHTRFTDARSRTLVASIQGSDVHAGTIALVAHLDEPGANDNASGVAATVAMATGYLRAIRAGTLARPRRTITFLIGAEFECSREWLRSISDRVDLSLIIDMVGEDPEENGAVPLVERMPDPGAIWDRPPLDIHSQWGRSDVRQTDLVGSFLNDYIMAAMFERQQVTSWPVRSNPYEGGSDHESFLERGIPSVLLWHFTDPYYHTSLDRVDKVSADEMENVAVAALAAVHHFAQAGLPRAEEVLDIVMAAARKRMATESNTARDRLSLPVVADDPAQRVLVSDRERAILAAWSHWYREAVLSMEDFEPGHSTGEDQRILEAHIDEALSDLRRIEREALSSIDG